MNCVINVLKPPGMTSSNVVVFIRRLFNIKKVGHSGTLDPAAAGVLPVFCGKATRLCEYALADDKQYIGEICFGASTDTQDAQGAITHSSDKLIEMQQAEALFAAIKGGLSQVPPKYSAIKKDGKKLYEYARAGQDVEIRPRDVTIYDSEILRQTGINRYLFKISCSKGTYIRTICHDIGRQSGAYAHLSFLLRTRTGGMGVDDAVPLDVLQQAVENNDAGKYMIPMESVIDYMPEVVLHAAAEPVARNGGAITERHVKSCTADAGDTARLYAGDTFIGICVRTDDGAKISKVLG